MSTEKATAKSRPSVPVPCCFDAWPCLFPYGHKIDYVRAEHAPEGGGQRLVEPNPWATLSVHVVVSPASHAALEVGALTVHSFGRRKLLPPSRR